MGRPPWIPTKEILEQVETYASRGLTKQQIADCLGIHYDTLNEKSKAYPDFSEAIKIGQAKGIAHVANLLITSAEQMNVSAQIFYLKSRAKWSDQNLEEVKDAIKNELDNVREMVQQCMKEQHKS
jgi:hypothetical protein